MVVIALLLIACHGDARPEYCVGRSGDADCDGVPDDRDRCPDTEVGELHDALGCSGDQSSGCAVSAGFPEDGAEERGRVVFSWQGTCDVYLLQLADDPTFPAGATRTAVRTSATEVLASGDERYWRVVGGKKDGSAGSTTEAREIAWQR